MLRFGTDEVASVSVDCQHFTASMSIEFGAAKFRNINCAEPHTNERHDLCKHPTFAKLLCLGAFMPEVWGASEGFLCAYQHVFSNNHEFFRSIVHYHEQQQFFLDLSISFMIDQA